MTRLRLKSLLIAAGLSLSTVATTSTSFAAPPPKAFGELPLGFDAAISPDGKSIATIVNYDGQYYVLSQDLNKPEEKPVTTPLGGNLRPRYVKWVNNDRYVIGVEKSDEYRGTPFTVTHLYTKSHSKGDGRFVLKSRIFRQFNDRVVDWLDDDPEHILMAYSMEEFDPFPNIYRINVATGKPTRVQKRRLGIQYWMSDDEGVPRLGWGQTDSGDDRMKILDPTTGKWENYTEYPGLSTNTSVFSIIKDGRELIIGDYAGRDTLGIYIYDLAQKKITRKLFHNDEYDASGVVVSRDGETVLGAKYVAEKEETELLGEYGTSLTKLRSKYKDYSVGYVDQTEDGNTLIVKMSSPYDPGGLFIYKAKTEELTLLQGEYSNLSSEQMGNVVSVKYTARDGQKIPAFVTLPPTVTTQAGLKNLPFIILPHGGPYGRDAKQFDYFAQFFATRGYGVMQMNFRGSSGYGKAFQDAGRNNWLVMQEDVEDATKYLLRKGYADPDRTCIAGWSYGGYAALMGAAKDNEGLYDCVIAMAALTDINDAKRDLRKYRGGRHAAKDFFGEAMQDRSVRRANSPVHVADNIKVPVFIAHGDQDENVQFDQFTKMRKALKKAGVKTSSMAFEDEDHFLSRQDNREAFFVGVDKFLTDVVGPSEYAKK